MAQATYSVDIIAKLLMLTPRRVQQLANDGVFPKGERGKYELVPTVQGYIKFLKDRAIGGDVQGDDSEHKRRLMKARADIAEMEAERMAGELVPVDAVEKTWTDIVARFRARMLAVPPKAAPLTSVDATVEGNHEIIETFIHEGLAELAATPIISIEATETGGGSDDEDGGAAPETDDL